VDEAQVPSNIAETAFSDNSHDRLVAFGERKRWLLTRLHDRDRIPIGCDRG